MGSDVKHEKKQAALSIERLSHSYGTHRALIDVNLEVYPGEVFGLLGPNGAGKTTIISNLVTLQQPTQGRLKVFGVDVVQQPKQAKAMMGLVPQELVHHGFFSVIEVLRYHAMFYGIKRQEEELAAVKMKKAAMKLKKESAMMLKKSAMEMKKASAMKMKMKKSAAKMKKK